MAKGTRAGRVKGKARAYVDFSKARGAMGRFSEKGRPKARAAMRARAKLTITGGIGVHSLGLILLFFGNNVVPVAISSVIAFFGLVMVGFGFAYHQGSK